MSTRSDKVAHRSARPIGPTTPHESEQVTCALIGLDAIATKMEQTWGMGRLITLCRDNARLGFRSGWTQFADAQAQSDTERTLTIIRGLIQCWRIMDAQATADGHQPLADDVWEAVLDDGRVMAICRTYADAAAALRSGRATVAYSMAEIARLLPKLDILGAIKAEFPGAVVERVTPRTEGFAESWATVDQLHDMLYGDVAA